MSTSSYETLRLISTGLAPGTSRTGEVCPFCQGGRSREKSLSITRLRTGESLYICHRAQCGRSGRIGASYTANYTPPQLRAKSDQFEPRHFTGKIERLPDDVTEQLITKYGFNSRDLDNDRIGWDSEANRTVWKVCSPTGATRGYESRAFRDDDKPKTLHYRHSSDPWVGYFPGVDVGNDDSQSSEAIGRRSGGALVVVEDVVSSVKIASSGCSAASLMGSHVSMEKLLDLMDVSEQIILCLDKDATYKSTSYLRRFGLLCPGIVCVPLERDLKYETPQFIREIVCGAL